MKFKKDDVIIYRYHDTLILTRVVEKDPEGKYQGEDIERISGTEDIMNYYWDFEEVLESGVITKIKHFRNKTTEEVKLLIPEYFV